MMPSSHVCGLSQTARDYMSTVMDPQGGPLVGIPDGSAVTSQKLRVWSRGTLVAGNGSTTGDLSIYFNPIGCLTNTQACLTWAVPSTANTLNSAFSQGGGSALCNGPYSIASLAAGNYTSGRLVSAELRLRYIGTELNKGGEIIGLQQPTHESIVGITTSAMLAHSSANRYNVNLTNDWYRLAYRPADNDDLFYLFGSNGSTAFNGTYNAAGTQAGQGIIYNDSLPFCAVYITGPSTTISNSFEFEVWAVVEFTGQNVPGRTINHPDVQGYQCVISSLAVNDERYASQGGNSYRSMTNYNQYHSSGVKGAGIDVMATPGAINTNTMRPDYVPASKTTNNRFSDAFGVATEMITAAAPYVGSIAQYYLRRRNQNRMANRLLTMD